MAAPKHKLVTDVLNGSVTSAVELARREACGSVSDLLRVVKPLVLSDSLERPSVALLDCCADAMALLRELRAKSECPTVEIQVPKGAS